MHELIASILSLPEFTLTDDEWEALSNIISGLEEKTIEEITVHISKIEGDSTLKSNTKLISYITKWLAIVEGIKNWLQHLNKMWEKITNTPLAADDLLPLCIELVPSKKAKLKQLSAKLDQVNRIYDITGYGYGVTTLHFAISAKLMELQSPSNNQAHDNNAPLIKSVASAICIHEKLSRVTAEYRIEMLNAFVERFKLLDNSTYLAYLNNFNHKDGALNKFKFIDAIIKNSEQMVPAFTHDEITFYFQKYMVINDIYDSLIRDDKVTHILTEFAAKFSYHREFLYKNDKRLLQAAKSGFDLFYSLFATKTIEKRFIELAFQCMQNLPQVTDKIAVALSSVTGSASVLNEPIANDNIPTPAVQRN